MPAEYPIWKSGETPNTLQGPSDAVARRRQRDRDPGRRCQVSRQQSADVFELVSTDPSHRQGQERYEVYCAWFGVCPPTVFPRILVRRGSFRIITQYTGSVADDISVE